MWREDHSVLIGLVERMQGTVARYWLVIVDIERRAADRIRFECSDQRVLIDQSTPGRVDKERGRLHHGELRRADDAFGFLIQGELHGENIGLREQFVPFDEFKSIALFEFWKADD